MYTRRDLICLYLKGSVEGTWCEVAGKQIRQIEDGDIRVCMSRHFEACSYYISSLRELYVEPHGCAAVGNTQA